jgi:soluble lytic murein transglycosylase-like protein
MKTVLLSGLVAVALAGCAARQPAPSAPAAAPSAPTARGALDDRIAYYARIYNVPPALVHRVVRRESNYNPAARNGPYWGLMQIRYDTAQGMGYRGPAARLLDADTNMTYAVAYLSNAWKLSGGSHDRAVQLYAGGYYYEAKRQGMLGQMIKAAN